MRKKRVIKILTSVFCIVLCLFSSIIPTFAEGSEGADTVEVGNIGDQLYTYSLEQYPYLSMEIATSGGINKVGQGVVRMPLTLLHYASFDFVVANNGSNIVLEFISQGIRYRAICEKMVFSFTRSSANDDVHDYKMTLDLVFQNCRVWDLNDRGETVQYWGQFPKIINSYGVCKYNEIDGEPDDSSIVPYYDTQRAITVDGSYFYFTYALTVLNLDGNILRALSDVTVDFYLPFGQSNFEAATYNGDVEYGFGTVLDAVDWDNTQDISAWSDLPFGWRFTFGKELFQDALNTGYSVGIDGRNEQSYNEGFADGTEKAGKWNIGTLISGIFEGQYNLFSSLLDFDIPIGNTVINFATIAGMLIALILIIVVVRFILK